jgi:hypothetical protein
MSVLGRCFTKQTGDMVYTMAENSWLSQLWLDARRCVYALERDSNRGSTPAVLIELSEGRNVRDRSVPRVRHLASNCLQVDQALRRGWPGGPVGPDKHAAQLPPLNLGRDCERSPRTAEAIPHLGSEEAQGTTRTNEPERELAGGKYGGSDPQPGRAHQPEEEEAACHAQFAAVLDGDGA